MNKKTWLLIAIISAIWICLFPILVLGEGSSTYIVLHANECLLGYKSGTYKLYFTSNSDVRFCLIKDYVHNSHSTVRAFVSTEPFSVGMWERSASNTNTCGTSYSNNASLYNGYYVLTSRNSANFDNLSDVAVPKNLPLSSDVKADAIYYTYGDGAIGPTEPINWGLLRDTSYTTRIAGSGQAARQNIDVITWEKSIDTNGNDISECEVEVQAVYGKFTGNTLVDLWETDLQDFAISGSVTLGVLPANSGIYTVSWQKVIEDLNTFDFDLLIAHEVNQQIEKNGWYYQIRLLGSDGTVGEWQTLYTPLSIGGKASEIIINNNSFDMSVYQVYQDLSTINNNTSITITYIDTDYTINNPSDGTEPEGGTNLWDVLKELISGIFQILAKLGDLVGNLIDGLIGIFQNLFTPSEVDQEINNNINVEVNTYLEESQPGLNDIHNNIDTWKLQLEDIANDYANGGDCIIAWDDVSIDLSAFNAGTVTFIPGGTYDLKTAFINLLTAFGVSYSTYEMIVSAIIYISLIVLISHKVKGFLKT